MINLSDHTLNHLKYNKHPDEDELDVHFRVFRVYSILGIHFLSDNEPQTSKAIEFGKGCRAVISKSINQGCLALTGDQYVDDDEERKWIEVENLKPPFLLICYEEHDRRIIRGGYRREEGDVVRVYEAFPEGMPDLEKWEKELLPNIETAMVVKFSTLDRPVSLVFIDRTVSGTSLDGKAVHELKFTFRADGIISRGRDARQLEELLENAADLSGTLIHDTTHHFSAAVHEDDRLRKFLSYFMFIERETHKQFKKLKYKDEADSIIQLPDRLVKSGGKFFEERFAEAKNLRQRFIWCSLLVWTQLDDEDVSDFVYVKKFRDEFAHGEDISDDDLPVEKARLLAMKILGTQSSECESVSSDVEAQSD